MPVLDASVYCALIHSQDRFHEISSAWFRRVVREREALAAPTLLMPEVAGAIRRLTSDEELASGVVSELMTHGLIELYALTLERGRRAAAIAAECRVRGADAVYLALAEELGDTLVTLDRQQRERGASIASVKRPD